MAKLVTKGVEKQVEQQVGKQTLKQQKLSSQWRPLEGFLGVHWGNLRGVSIGYVLRNSPRQDGRSISFCVDSVCSVHASHRMYGTTVLSPLASHHIDHPQHALLQAVETAL